MQDFNLHTHTYRCGHGVGTPREYVESAIKNGFSTLGFSEHIGFSDWVDSKERMSIEEMPVYEEEIHLLKEEYKEKIDILLGYECEFFPDAKKYYQEIKERVDYLILGQHSIQRNNRYLHFYASDKEVRKMAELVVEGIETGLFSLVAHPDYFMLGRKDFSKECKIAIREIAEAAKNKDIPLEINLKGFYTTYKNKKGVESALYPNKESFAIIKEIGPKTIIGYDAHVPLFLKKRYLEKKVKDFLEIEPIVRLAEIERRPPK